MDPLVEEALGPLNNVIREALTRFGEDVQEDIRLECGDVYPPASKAGNPPHFRGKGMQDIGVPYIDTILTYVVSDASLTGEHSVTIYTEDIRGEWFEYNTNPKMEARPHFAPAYDKWAPIFNERMQQIIEDTLG